MGAARPVAEAALDAAGRCAVQRAARPHARSTLVTRRRPRAAACCRRAGRGTPSLRAASAASRSGCQTPNARTGRLDLGIGVAPVAINRADVTLGTGGSVRVEGKGRKHRAVPLTKEAKAVLAVWVPERGGRPEDPLFATRTGRRLSRDAVERRVTTHVTTATKRCPSLKGKRVHPHVLRHSCAMALLRAGVNSTVIALWLGHADIRSTQPYIHADMTIKERALALVAPATVKPGRYTPGDEVLAFLGVSDNYADVRRVRQLEKPAFARDLSIVSAQRQSRPSSSMVSWRIKRGAARRSGPARGGKPGVELCQERAGTMLSQQKSPASRGLLSKRRTGVEPATFGLGSRRSTN